MLDNAAVLAYEYQQYLSVLKILLENRLCDQLKVPPGLLENWALMKRTTVDLSEDRASARRSVEDVVKCFVVSVIKKQHDSSQEPCRHCLVNVSSLLLLVLDPQDGLVVSESRPGSAASHTCRRGPALSLTLTRIKIALIRKDAAA